MIIHFAHTFMHSSFLFFRITQKHVTPHQICKIKWLYLFIFISHFLPLIFFPFTISSAQITTILFFFFSCISIFQFLFCFNWHLPPKIYFPSSFPVLIYIYIYISRERRENQRKQGKKRSFEK